jgi:hypothetical protein
MTSAAEGAAVHADGGADKLTGARNENSVLFSLSALTGGAAAPSPAAPERDPASNKADLRALMGGGGGGAPAKSKIDDIMNLSGGGVYSPGLLAAPALAPPPIDMMSAAAAPTDSGSKSKSVMLAIGGGLLAVGAVALAFTTMSSKADSTDKSSAAASAAAEVAPMARVGNAANAANAPTETPSEQPGTAREPVHQGESAKPETSAGAAPVAVAPGSPPPKSEGEKTERKVATAPRAEKPAGPAAPAGLPPPPAAAPAPAPAAPAPAAPAAGGSGEIVRASMMSALGAAATAAQSCKKPDGPTGSGRVTVVFANNGQATTATVEGPPFAGTPVGGCIAAKFRSAHIPPFTGSVVQVHKSFTIN